MELKTYFAQDASGNIMPGATVTVYEAGTATLATGLQDESGSPLASPFTADSSAKVAFYAPDGLYDINVVGNGRTVTIRAKFADLGADEFVASLATNGYQKLPSGLIIQWGSYSGAVGGLVSTTFPLAFTSSVLHIIPFYAHGSDPSAAGDVGGGMIYGVPTLSGFTARNRTGFSGGRFLAIGY